MWFVEVCFLAINLTHLQPFILASVSSKAKQVGTIVEIIYEKFRRQ